MGTKRQPGEFDCYKNAEPDEPMFILLGRDPVAPLLIEMWCYYRGMLIWLGLKPKTDLAMIAEARSCAEQMHRWRENNRPALRRVA